MKKLIFTLFTLLAFAASAQIKVPGTHVELTLPQGEWEYYKTIKEDKNTTSYLYFYVDHLVVSAQGDTVVPWVRVVVRKGYTGSALDYAGERWGEQPYQALNEQTEDLPASDGIGYLGAYTSPKDQKDYMFRMMYLKDRNVVVEVRAETSRETYADFDDDFEAIINSITLTK